MVVERSRQRRFIVKFAWSELCAIGLWREGRVLEGLRANDPSLALPEVVVASRAPALLETESAATRRVLVHGDLHGYNQLWDRASASLVAVVDFEASGVADRHFDLRYLPGNSAGPQLVLAGMAAYERLSGIRLSIDRVMPWHVLTALGDALWRTEAGVALPGGGTATTYVDRLATQLAALDLD